MEKEESNMEIMKAIETRVSIRKYRPDVIEAGKTAVKN